MTGPELDTMLRSVPDGMTPGFVLPGGGEITGAVTRQVREGSETLGVIVRTETTTDDIKYSGGHTEHGETTVNYAFVPASSILCAFWGAE